MKALLKIICLLISVQGIGQINKQTIQNLTEDNVEAYLRNNNYNKVYKTEKGEGFIYTGEQSTDGDAIISLSIAFKNDIVFAYVIGFITDYSIDRSDSFFKDLDDMTYDALKGSLLEAWNVEGRFKTLVDNYLKFETDWREDEDYKEMVSIEREINGNHTKFLASRSVVFNELELDIFGVDILEIDTYDLEGMIRFFLRDAYLYSENNFKYVYDIPSQDFYKDDILVEFKDLEGETIALSYGLDVENKIIIHVDPVNWRAASLQKRWYILYHELGHDKFNLEHGNGGKMMFNFVETDYSWDDFLEDREYMFKAYYRRYSK